jgi:hypothetical protein
MGNLATQYGRKLLTTSRFLPVRRCMWHGPFAVETLEGMCLQTNGHLFVSHHSHKIVYNHQTFLNTESFLVAFYNGTLKRFPSSPSSSADLSWSSRKRVGSQLDLDHLPGPRSVSFAGLRFKVDRKLQYISWMGWGLYLGFDRDMGLSLWDIRMRNERIVYQVRLDFPYLIKSADIQTQIRCSLHLRRR